MVWGPVVALLGSFFFVLWFTPVTVRLANAWGAIDHPDPRKVHHKPMPRLGGIGIVVAVFVALLWVLPLDSRFYGVIVGGAIIALLGFVDDLRGVRPAWKLAFQSAAALVTVLFHVKVSFVSLPLDGLVATSVWAIPITVAWIVLATNAVNLLDGLDGLATGIACVSSVTLAYFSWYNGAPGVVVVALALIGATLAFLRYNAYPAKVFLGDTGATFCGFMLGALSVMGLAKGSTFASLIVPFFILGVPIVDTVATVVRRLVSGAPLFRADRGHLHHKLMDHGMGQVRTVYLEYVIAAISGLCGLLIGKLAIGYYSLAIVSFLIVSVGMLGGGLTAFRKVVRFDGAEPELAAAGDGADVSALNTPRGTQADK